MNTLPGYYELEPEDCTFTDVTAPKLLRRAVPHNPSNPVYKVRD